MSVDDHDEPARDPDHRIEPAYSHVEVFRLDPVTEWYECRCRWPHGAPGNGCLTCLGTVPHLTTWQWFRRRVLGLAPRAPG